MSAALSTNDWLTASTPHESANARHSRSRSVNALIPRSIPGRLSPLRERSSPPTRTVQSTSVPCAATTSSWIWPSLSEERVAGFHHLRQLREAHRNAPLVADDVLGGEDEGVARLELDRLVGDGADPHLRPGEVGHDGDVPPGSCGRGPKPSTTRRCDSKSPCEKFSRATFIPASTSCRITSGDSEAGPMVQTIFVLWAGVFIVVLLVRESIFRSRRRSSPYFT